MSVDVMERTEQKELTGQELLDEALRRREANKKEQEEKENNFYQGWGDFNLEEYTGLENQKEKVIRVVGNPVEVRKHSYDPLVVLETKVVKPAKDIKTPKKGYYKIRRKYILNKGSYECDPQCILTRFINTVYEGKWINYTEKDIDGEKIIQSSDGTIINTKTESRNNKGYYLHTHKDTKVYFELTAGNKQNKEMFPVKVNNFPARKVVMNVIDRMDDWCKVNKKTKLLMSKITPFHSQDDEGQPFVRHFMDTGIPLSLYDMIFDQLQANGSLDVDLVITKDKDLRANYKVHDVNEEAPRYITEESKKLGNANPLTEEENNYEKFNLDKRYAPSSYREIKIAFFHLFKLCDAELGTNFTEELLALVEKEKAEKGDNVQETNNEQAQLFDSNVSEENEDTSQATNNEVRRESKLELPTQTDLAGECSKKFLYWNELTEEDKQNYLSALSHFDNGFPVYKVGTDAPGCSNTACLIEGKMTIIPHNVGRCPKCGVVFS